MPIETLDDWNDRITSFNTNGCCECEVKGQDAIGFTGESLAGYILVQGFTYFGDQYLTRVYTFYNGGTRTFTYDSEYACSLGGVVIEAQGAITVTDEGDTGGGIFFTTYITVIDVESAFASGRAALEAAIDWDGMYKEGSVGAAYYEDLFPLYRNISFNRTKFRKEDHGQGNPVGSYLKLTFDVIDFTELGAGTTVSSGLTLEWTGLFDINNQTDPSHFTDWFYIDPPPEQESREIRNLVWTRFHSTRYGNKQQNSFENGDTFVAGTFGAYP